MSTTTSVDYLYRLQYSRSTKEYKLSSKNEENERTISVTKKGHCVCSHHSPINIPTHSLEQSNAHTMKKEHSLNAKTLKAQKFSTKLACPSAPNITTQSIIHPKAASDIHPWAHADATTIGS